MNNRELGRKYESKAADFIVNNGYKILCRNFSCRIGEIDIIATEQGYLCFIEVKYRSTTNYGFPSEAINPHKIHKITRTAQYYMLTNNYPEDTPCRFDVVEILKEDISIKKNAFYGE